MSVNIHGKKYITVAERLLEAKKDIQSINTEVLFQEPVVIKATVITTKGTFTGISAANPDKALEKSSPYEVAETSAVGRALAFAGYEIEEGIASAEEINKAEEPRPYYSIEKQQVVDPSEELPIDQEVEELGNCKKCGAPNARSLKGNVYCTATCWLK